MRKFILETNNGPITKVNMSIDDFITIVEIRISTSLDNYKSILANVLIDVSYTDADGNDIDFNYDEFYCTEIIRDANDLTDPANFIHNFYCAKDINYIMFNLEHLADIKINNKGLYEMDLDIELNNDTTIHIRACQLY